MDDGALAQLDAMVELPCPSLDYDCVSSTEQVLVYSITHLGRQAGLSARAFLR